jgi:hypothetical protein
MYHVDLETADPPSAAGKTVVVELPVAAAVEPDTEGASYFNRGSSLVRFRGRRELRAKTMSATIPAEALNPHRLERTGEIVLAYQGANQ